jgi:hypothetical protein
MNQVLAEINAEPPDVGNDRIPEIQTDAVFNGIVEVESVSNFV